MRPNEWPDLLPFVQSVVNNSPSPPRGDIPPITAMTGQEATPLIQTFYRSSALKPVAISDVAPDRALNVKLLCERMKEIHPVVQNTLLDLRRRNRENIVKGMLPNFTDGYFVLVSREDFSACGKLALRWRGPRRIVRAVNDFVYQVEDLRNGNVEDVHATKLKFYHEASLNAEAIMPHVLSSETGMEVQRLLRLHKTGSGLIV